MNHNPLSLFVFFTRSISKIFLLFFIVLISVFIVSATTSLIGLLSSDNQTTLNLSKKITILSFEQSKLVTPLLTIAQITNSDNITSIEINQLLNNRNQPELKERLTTLGKVIKEFKETKQFEDKFFKGIIITAESNTIFGKVARPLFMISNNDRKDFYNILGAKIDTGVDCTEPNTIVQSTSLFKGTGSEIDADYGKNSPNPILKLYPIQGYVSGTISVDENVNLPIGFVNYNKILEDNNLYLSVVFQNKDINPQDSNEKLNEIRSKYASEGIEIKSFDSYNEEFKKENGSITIMSIIRNIVFVGGTLLSIFIFILYLNSRNEEIGLLLILGYNKNFIINKIIKEKAVIVALGFVFGYLATFILILYINSNIISNVGGTPISYTIPLSIALSLAVPLLVIISSYINLVIKMASTDAISIIEKK